ncbi:MAG: EF-hand domain-containing protein [Sphingomicrobium sp.]
MKSFLIAPLALSALIAGPLSAQTAAPAAAGLQPITRVNFAKHFDEIFGRIDTNKDGALSIAEIAAAEVKDKATIEAQVTARYKAEFDKFDTNKDGQISFSEYVTGRGLPNIPTDGKAMLSELDTNKDGKVSLQEYLAPQLVKFNRVDANKDGVASAEEQRKAATGR